MDVKMELLFKLVVLSCILSACLCEINSKFLTKGNKTTLHGQIEAAFSHTSVGCSSLCGQSANCRGILFNKHVEVAERCKLITTDSNNQIDDSAFQDYNVYIDHDMVLFTQPGLNITCTNPAVNLPDDWESSCPKAYFPLDSASEGSSYGNDQSLIDFTQTGIVGNAFTFDNPTGSYKASFTLNGIFQSPNYCFTTPDTCPGKLFLSTA